MTDALAKYRGQSTVVYALPRGGVVLGVVIAKSLAAPLDLLIPRKVGHPLFPEVAVCAVSETGYRLCNHLAKTIDRQWLAGATAREIAEAQRRRAEYLGGRTALSAKDKIAVVVDDGIATGLTMRAAIHDLKQQQPSKIIAASPVVPADTAELITAEVDELVALQIITDGSFNAVGAYYDNFPQVSDQEVMQLLREVAVR